jgi:hypothetical protein
MIGILYMSKNKISDRPKLTSLSKKCDLWCVYSNICPRRCSFTQYIYIWKLLYIFRVVPPPIIRSAYNCIYSIWYLSHRYCYLPDAVDTVVCAPDDGWRFHPKHVEQFPDINKLCKVASCWVYSRIDH